MTETTLAGWLPAWAVGADSVAPIASLGRTLLGDVGDVNGCCSLNR
ncbi:hypothetical protein [Mycobacteroides chelonae]|nr:hypothetical protein [Mycobacteroides chelonae]